MPGLHLLSPAWKKYQNVHPDGDQTQPATENQVSSGGDLNYSFHDFSYAGTPALLSHTCCPGLNPLFCWSFSPSYPWCFCESLFTTVQLSITYALVCVCVCRLLLAVKDVISFTEQMRLLASLHMWYPCANKGLV